MNFIVHREPLKSSFQVGKIVIDVLNIYQTLSCIAILPCNFAMQLIETQYELRKTLHN
jgi:hypothetical protein